MDYALTLLSAAADGKRHGCIINSLHQATSSYPAKFTITVNRDHETCKAIQAAGSFSATLLAADCPAELVDQFGYKSGRVMDKFAALAPKTDDAGNPYLTEHMSLPDCLPSGGSIDHRQLYFSLWERSRRPRFWAMAAC